MLSIDFRSIKKVIQIEPNLLKMDNFFLREKYVLLAFSLNPQRIPKNATITVYNSTINDVGLRT